MEEQKGRRIEREIEVGRENVRYKTEERQREGRERTERRMEGGAVLGEVAK